MLDIAPQRLKSFEIVSRRDLSDTDVNAVPLWKYAITDQMERLELISEICLATVKNRIG